MMKFDIKKYFTPKIQLITFCEVDILTTSESVDFKTQWLESL